uniref:Uncharacterized protein n=1 Tax=Setaria italica TaxID=4555 RepID=K3Y0S9_SETIT
MLLIFLSQSSYLTIFIGSKVEKAGQILLLSWIQNLANKRGDFAGVKGGTQVLKCFHG